MKTRLILLVIALVCISVSAFGAVAQIPLMKTVPYDGWGIKLEVPAASRRVCIAAKDDVELWEMHVFGDFVYFVQVVKVPANSLTSTAIEQDIQAQSNLGAKRGATKRWETDSNQGELFKGLSYFTKPDEDIPEAAVELRKVLRGRTGFVSAAWAPLKDDSGPMLIVGVIGPKGRDSEIEGFANYLVDKTVKPKPGAPDEGKPATASTMPARPHMAPLGAKPPVIKPSAASSFPALKKGEIQIVGAVESISIDRKCITVSAEEITLFKSLPVKLNPPRRKVLLLNTLPERIASGARVVVVGVNTGVGKPMKADFIEKAP